MATPRAVVVLFALVAACDGTDEQLPATIDAPAVDAPGPIDGAPDGLLAETVVCGTEANVCIVPAQSCCDVAGNGDTCINTGGACSGIPMACDGPEDCGATEECCFFDGSRSMCVRTDVCGTTGSISNEMCHVMADCDSGEFCCGTAPGPQLDLYAICTTGPCPQ